LKTLFFDRKTPSTFISYKVKKYVGLASRDDIGIAVTEEARIVCQKRQAFMMAVRNQLSPTGQ